MEQSYIGLRILDLTRVLAGPYATMIMADLGAEVIKIESDEGDDLRRMPPKWGRESAAFLALNRGKKSVVLDLKSASGKQAVLKLAARSDIVIESFRPGTMDRLGLGFDALSTVNPKLIYCAVSAFGHGPLGKGMPGYDPLLQAFSGILKSTGHPGQPPARIGPSAIDLTTGMWAAMQIMAALARRDRFDGPQRLEATLIDSSLNLMCHQLVSTLATGLSPEPQGSGSPTVAPYELFAARDGELMIAAGNDNLYRKLCACLGRDDLARAPNYIDMAGRIANRQALHDALEGELKKHTVTDWMDRLAAAGVPAGPVHTLKQCSEHPLVAERDAVFPCPTEDMPDLKLLRLPLGDLARPGRPPPTLGEHTDEVLASIGMG